MIGAIIKMLREERRISQKELAVAIKMGTTAINNYENGHRVPDANTVIRLADYFDVTTDYLLGKSNIRNEKDSEEKHYMHDKLRNSLFTLIERQNNSFVYYEIVDVLCDTISGFSSARKLGGKICESHCRSTLDFLSVMNDTLKIVKTAFNKDFQNMQIKDRAYYWRDFYKTIRVFADIVVKNAHNHANEILKKMSELDPDFAPNVDIFAMDDMKDNVKQFLAKYDVGREVPNDGEH